MKTWWSGLTKDQRVAVASFAVLSLAGALVTSFASDDNNKKYFALATTAAVFLLFERISRYAFENKIMDRFQDLAASKNDLRCIGGIAAGIEWFKRNNRGLKLVRNTVFTRSDAEAFVVKHHDLEGAIRVALRDGCDWRDLYCASESDAVQVFHASLSDADKRHYSAYELQESTPRMQVLLLQYQEPTNTKVLFGWSYKGGNESGSMVFLSESRETYRFFEEYLQTLMDHAEPTIKRMPAPDSAGPQGEKSSLLGRLWR